MYRAAGIEGSKETETIWVNYNISLTQIKTIWGCFSLLTMIPMRENSEVVIISSELWMVTNCNGDDWLSALCCSESRPDSM